MYKFITISNVFAPAKLLSRCEFISNSDIISTVHTASLIVEVALWPTFVFPENVIVEPDFYCGLAGALG